MEENVALDSSKQKKFVKSIKGIKKLIKKGQPVIKPAAEKLVKGGKKKRRIRDRGLVYLSHIPHGFYENEMTQYFKQFGKVTNVRVIRSKKTGMSKGYAFVEFGQPAVAQIVAETMNNYLMGKRLIKAEVVPAEKQRFAFRKNWNAENNPANNLRVKFKKEFNENKTDEQHLKKAKRLMKNLSQTKQKLKDLGINYDFFNAVDIPEALLNEPGVGQEQNKLVEETKSKKKDKNADKIVTEKAATKSKGKQDSLKLNGVNKKNVETTNKIKTVQVQHGKVVNTKAADIKQKEKKVKGVQPIENDQSDGDSDGSLEFDSDEFAAEEFDEFGSDSNEEDDAEESFAKDEPPKKSKKVALKQTKKGLPLPTAKVNKIKQNNKQEMKRKVPQQTELSAKKQKFEKKGKGNQSKQFKKKK